MRGNKLICLPCYNYLHISDGTHKIKIMSVRGASWLVLFHNFDFSNLSSHQYHVVYLIWDLKCNHIMYYMYIYCRKWTVWCLNVFTIHTLHYMSLKPKIMHYSTIFFRGISTCQWNTRFSFYKQLHLWGQASSCLALNYKYLKFPSPPTKYYTFKLLLR